MSQTPSDDVPWANDARREPTTAPGAEVLGYQGFHTDYPAADARCIDALAATRPWVVLVAVLILIVAGLMVLFGIGLLVAAVAGVAAGPTGGSVGLAVLGLLFYAAFAAFYVMPGLYLYRYAAAIKAVQRTRDTDDLFAALSAQKSFWKFVGVLVSIVVAFYVIVGGLALVFAALR